MSNSDSDTVEKSSDFGFVLAEARKTQNYTVNEVKEHLKIPADVIVAIEANDIDNLPAPTYTRGYLRAYAKFLEISEDSILEIYNRAVPHEQVTELKSRTKLPGETNSQSPLVQMVTMLLLLAGIAAVIYGSFQYYQKKADIMQTELESKEPGFTGNSLDSPGEQGLNIRQNARLTDNKDETDEAALVESAIDQSVIDGSEVNDSAIDTDISGTTEELVVEEKVEAEVETVAEESQQMSQNEIQQDVIKIFAEKGSWMQVHDANKTRLLYSMVPVGGSKVLRGQAPFRIKLGNAKTTQVLINNLDIDMSAFIRSNNTASFTVSSDGENIIFH